ncbi:MAG TPA: urease accessory protein UreD [Acetobacteraceae bacterium]|nr:urease accessory protein UreD [Acetobacteraceae bacterium]
MDGILIRSDLQRAIGEVCVSVKQRGGQPALDELRQVGCLKVRFPRADNPEWLNVVTLNTSGGIAGGDDLRSSFIINADARATIASQAAERFYRALPGSAASDVQASIAVGRGGAAEWLPQETILFNGCAVRRQLCVELAKDAWFLGVESLVFGRAAMGEVVERGSLRDLIEIRRGGRLLLHDPIRLAGEIAGMLRHPAVADGARAVATVVHVAPDAEAMLDDVRAAAPECGASAWDGMLIARTLASDSAALRASVVAILHVLRRGRTLPRVWQC